MRFRLIKRKKNRVYCNIGCEHWLSREWKTDNKLTTSHPINFINFDNKDVVVLQWCVYRRIYIHIYEGNITPVLCFFSTNFTWSLSLWVTEVEEERDLYSWPTSSMQLVSYLTPWEMWLWLPISPSTREGQRQGKQHVQTLCTTHVTTAAGAAAVLMHTKGGVGIPS